MNYLVAANPADVAFVTFHATLAWH